MARTAQARFLLYHPAGTGLNTRMTTAFPPSPAMTGQARAPAAHKSFEAQLAAVGRDRDKQAFLSLFDHFAPRLKSFLMKGGATPEQAEELVQEVMLTVWNRAATYDPARAGAATWIFTIARNRRIDALRKTGRPEVDINDAAYIADETLPQPDQAVIQSDRTQKIAEAMKTLPKEQSEVVYKAFFEDKTHREIAEETKLPLGTIKSRLRLALDRLRPQLRKDML